MTRILYVDGDPGICPVLSRIFEHYTPLSVCSACSGEEALAWLSWYHADVIVSGYQLPGMTGIALLHALRSRGIDTPFIVFSERDSELVRNEAGSDEIFGIVSRNGSGRRAIMNLLRLVLWAAESRRRDHPSEQETA